MSFLYARIIIDTSKANLLLTVFDWMQKPGGIIALLDEAWYGNACLHLGSSQKISPINFCRFGTNFICSISSMFPKSTHETFAEKLYQTFKSNKRFIKPKLSRTEFAIAHYAGEVN